MPSPALRAPGFVLRRFAPADYESARVAREEPESARWVNPLPQPDVESMTRFLDEARQAGKLLHLAIADAAEVDEGEIAYVVAPEARG